MHTALARRNVVDKRENAFGKAVRVLNGKLHFYSVLFRRGVHGVRIKASFSFVEVFYEVDYAALVVIIFFYRGGLSFVGEINVYAFI